MSSTSTKKRSVADPTAKGSSNFLWVIVAVLAIAALVIGLVVWQSNKDRTANLADRAHIDYSGQMEYADGVVTLKAENAAEGTPEVSLFEDFSCPHCADLAKATDDQMLEEVENGNLIVNIHTLNFMDHDSEGHSTHALASVLPLAEAGDANAYLNLRYMLFEDQQSVYNNWDGDKAAEAAKAFGASDDVVKSIRDEADLDEANSVGHANGDRLNEMTGTVSSPRIIQDGQDLQTQNIDDWVSQVVGK